MSCGSGADEFIEKHFKDCVYNVRDYIGFCLGLAAIVFWIIAQIPQYYRNYKTKSAEALSPWFLAQWLLGDTFNLIGALLQGQQLPTTVYTAMYFVIADMFMMMQYIYYGALQRRRETVLKLQARRRHHHRHHHRRHDGSSLVRDTLISHEQRSSPEPAGHGQTQQQQQQQQGQPPPWTAQQQERRRVPHQAGLHLHASQQPQLGCGDPPCAAAISEQQWVHDSSEGLTPSLLEQQQQRNAQQPGLQDKSCSSPDDNCSSDCSSSSSHSSSKKPRRISQARSPPAAPPDLIAHASCAAAVGPSGGWGIPSVRVPSLGLHWGGVRSVVAVAVLVSMGLVSLLPASTTRGLYPIRLSGASAGVLHPPGPDTLSARAMQAGLSQQTSSIQPQTQMLPGSIAAASAAHSSGSSRSWARQQHVGDQDPDHSWSFVVGTGLGYFASVLYLCSRVSQIHKNYSRKSSEGLALVMFIMAVCANFCTGTGIILRTFTWVELKEQLPWIIGSLGTISLDMVILWQSKAYSKEGATTGGVLVPGAQHQHHHHRHHHRHHQEDLQPEQQQLLQGDMNGVAAIAAAPARGDGQAAGARPPGEAVLGGTQPAAHHRSGLLGRRHAAAAAAGDLSGDGVEVVIPLVGSASRM